MKKNYHKLMLEEVENLEIEHKPKLLMHSCCAPCSSYVLEYLNKFFDMEIYFFNPNIYPEEEYNKRLDEQIRLVEEMKLKYKVVGCEYNSEEFFNVVKGYEHLGERSERCERCILLRLEDTARYGVENKFDYFTTTLTISPMKDVNMINKIGEELEEKYKIKFLNSDFKKNNGFKRSIELSKKHSLYRQEYCGCIFSQKEYLKRIHKDI